MGCANRTKLCGLLTLHDVVDLYALLILEDGGSGEMGRAVESTEKHFAVLDAVAEASAGVSPTISTLRLKSSTMRKSFQGRYILNARPS